MSRDEFVAAVAEMADQVWDFHERWGMWPHGGRPRSVVEAISERQAILDEEIQELAQAVEGQSTTEISEEAADVLFVSIGHVQSLGSPGLNGVRTVTAKNAAKTEKTHAIRADTGKLLPTAGKPHKWE